MKIDTIYLDMDGVLCDFEGRYIDLFKEMPGATRERKEFSRNWTDFVKGDNFSTLDDWPGSKTLLDYVAEAARTHNITVKILTSSGGHKYHDEVKEQKIRWLCNKGIPHEAIVVPGRRKKAAYATPSSILIDDTADVIDVFNEEGGIGILHKNAINTVKLLDILLNT